MATYFMARKAERLFREYRDLAIGYWAVKPADPRRILDRAHGISAPENDESRKLRETISRIYPQVQFYSDLLGIHAGEGTSLPAPAIGGHAIQFNLLFHVIDQEVGHSRVSRRDVQDAIERSIGAAQVLQEHLLWRQAINPFWWIIEGVSFVIRIPFLILQRAGLPEKIEETAWAHFLKALLLFVILGTCAYWGIKVTVGDVLRPAYSLVDSSNVFPSGKLTRKTLSRFYLRRELSGLRKACKLLKINGRGERI